MRGNAGILETILAAIGVNEKIFKFSHFVFKNNK